jgi:hypothetical protein
MPEINADSPDLRDAERQMLMARPWHAAEENSIWEVTGEYRLDRGRFTACLAMVLPGFATGGHVLFKFIGALTTGDGFDVVGPEQITHAVPLLLMHRDEPGVPYWEDDRVWMTEVAR